MFTRFATLLPVAALIAVVAAAPNAIQARGGQCSSGSAYCCNQKLDGATKFTDKGGKDGNSLIGAVLGVVAIPDLQCDPISVIAIAGMSCSTQTACCTDDKQNGLVNAECIPVNANL